MGFSNNIVVKNNKGEIYIWGSNENGQLGKEVPKAENFIKIPIILNKKAKKCILGESHSVIILNNGTVELCGWNYYGQLGNNTTCNDFIYKPLKFDNKVIDVSCGASYTFRILENYDVFGFGKNEYGNLGLGFKEIKVLKPHKLKGKFKEIICGYWHTFLKDLNNKYYSCGSNQHGQLLNQKEEDYQVNIEPILMESFYKIAAGYECTIIINKEQELYFIGNNKYGLIGLGHIQEIKKLTKINNNKFIDINIGYEHCIALSTDKKLFSWGLNKHGQLGLGDLDTRFIPTEVIIEDLSINSPKKDISRILCGHNQTFVLFNNGDLYSCGNNSCGELGLGDINNRSKLTKINLSNVLFFDNDYWNTFKILYFAKKKSNIIWEKIPKEIIIEICKRI